MRKKNVKSFLIILSIALLISCNKNNENELIGKWELIEVLSDPGDGTGTFTKVSSKKTIKFNNDNVISSNGSLCTISTESKQSTSGTYSLTDSTYKSDDCADFNYHFKIENDILIITYQCIEACQAKYKKR